MPVIHMGSIMQKVKAHAQSDAGKRRMQEVLDKYRQQGVRSTKAGGRILSESDMLEAADKLMTVLIDTARTFDLPASVMEHFDNLMHTGVYHFPDGSAMITIWFSGDLHRDSLKPQTYDGIENVIALLNNGYDPNPKMENVWGEWHDRRIHGLSERTGLQFIQQAVKDFNSNYGAEYNVTAIANDVYVRPGNPGGENP